MLESATTALAVLNRNVASFKSRLWPPIHPLTAWVLGVSIVWIPVFQFRVSSPVSDRTEVCPAGMWSWSGSVRIRTSPEISLGFSQGSSLMAGMAMVSRLCSTSVRMVAELSGFSCMPRSCSGLSLRA